MKIINFTEKKILKALLNGTKRQTIRPAWRVVAKRPLMVGSEKNKEGIQTKIKSAMYTIYGGKPARYKVGDVVQIMWNQRSKFRWFCSECGVGLREIRYDEVACLEHGTSITAKIITAMRERTGVFGEVFNKRIRVVKITEVGKIVIGKGLLMTSGDTAENIARLDGFDSAKDFFEFFDRAYDLSSPREFWVYRWEEIMAEDNKIGNRSDSSALTAGRRK